MMVNLFKIFLKKAGFPICSYFFMLKLMEFPTTNKNVGKTKSVRVNPFHSACSSGEKVVFPFPGEFTIIIRATSIPLKTSKERYRFFNVDMFGCFGQLTKVCFFQKLTYNLIIVVLRWIQHHSCEILFYRDNNLVKTLLYKRQNPYF